MSNSSQERMTPVERLHASRAQMRFVLLQAQSPTDSMLNTLLKPLAAERPFTLATLAALVGAAIMIAKPWRSKALATPLLTWAIVALFKWMQGQTPKH